MSASSEQDRLLSRRSGCYQKPSSQQPCALPTTLLARGTKCTPLHPTHLRTSCDFNHLHANKLGERRPTGFRSMILCALRMPNLPGFSSLSPLHPTPQLNCSFSLSTSQSHCVFPHIQRASSSSDLFPNKINILIFIPGSLADPSNNPSHWQDAPNNPSHGPYGPCNPCSLLSAATAYHILTVFTTKHVVGQTSPAMLLGGIFGVRDSDSENLGCYYIGELVKKTRVM